MSIRLNFKIKEIKTNRTFDNKTVIYKKFIKFAIFFLYFSDYDKNIN